MRHHRRLFTGRPTIILLPISMLVALLLFIPIVTPVAATPSLAAAGWGWTKTPQATKTRVPYNTLTCTVVPTKTPTSAPTGTQTSAVTSTQTSVATTTQTPIVPATQTSVVTTTSP